MLDALVVTLAPSDLDLPGEFNSASIRPAMGINSVSWLNFKDVLTSLSTKSLTE